jgi:large subunit ribosomal protein L25
MEHIAIVARPRSATMTKGERKRLRRAGHIPAAIFGRGPASTLVTVEARDLARVFSAPSGRNTLIDVSVDDVRQLVRIADFDIDPISRMFLHVGLHRISGTELEKATIPIELIGEPEAIRMGTGSLVQGSLIVEVRALPDALPGTIQIDISELHIGSSLHASDIVLPKGVELVSPPDTSIVALHAARVRPTEGDLDEDSGPARDASSAEESLVGV